MTDKPITSLEDARHLKRAGLPLNMPVEKRTFSQKYSEHWFALMDAHGRFMLAIHKFADDQTAVRWWSVQRRYVALDRAAIRCLDLVGELGGRDAEPVFKSEQDEHEYALLAWFITERAIPFINFWADAIDTVEEGNELAIEPGEIPPWVDPE